MQKTRRLRTKLGIQSVLISFEQSWEIKDLTMYKKNDSSQQRGSGANRRQRHKNKLLKQGDTGNSLSRRQIHAKFPTRYQQNPDQESNTQQREIEAR
mmetsp:Transcript_16046/g.28465  ORF Transcript_16046/g.28465 Transcript_16046/m.28465 type:complete len:97 (-) Transcript_16046:418-708(-)